MPTRRDSERTQQLFQEASIDCSVCGDLAEVCRELRKGAGVLLLTDETLAHDQTGQLAETMREQAPWSAVPVIVVAREGTSHQVERSASEALGSVIVVERPVRMRPLLSLTLSVLRGHSALRRSQLVLAEQAEQLRSADRRKDEFLATLAHELRNPLAPIRAGLDLLGQSRDEGSTQRALKVMDRQLKHMVRLIDDLLDVSRITQGRLELVRTRLELGAVIDAAVEACRPHLERHRHQLRVEIEDLSLPLDADMTRLAQVVGNVLNNACKYTPAGGMIEISARQQESEAVIEVSDNGIGIPETQLSEVFEMFSQVNRTMDRSQGGLGIGLALVRKLVELHGGSVTAKSPGPGRGSTFTLRLPVAAPATKADETGDGAALAPPPLRKRVLVVDDNEDAAEMLALMLKQAEYDTSQASDGPSALAAVESFIPDVVILDIGLPGMSGYDVARALRRQKGSGLELIALTGWGSREDKQKAFEAGFDVHLTKPVDANMLYRTLAELEQREAAQLRAVT
jgi:signal transduction histidine kinase/ActR/RegA family two-component response regulator